MSDQYTLVACSYCLEFMVFDKYKTELWETMEIEVMHFKNSRFYLT